MQAGAAAKTDAMHAQDYAAARTSMLGDFANTPVAGCPQCMANAKAKRRADRLQLANTSMLSCPEHAAEAQRLRADMDEVENMRCAKQVYIDNDPNAPEDLKTGAPLGFTKATPDQLADMGLTQKMLTPPDSEFKAAVYMKDPEVWGDDMEPPTIVAFRGSTPATEDWVNNFHQDAGEGEIVRRGHAQGLRGGACAMTVPAALVALRRWLRPASLAALTLTGTLTMALPMPPSDPAPKFKLDAPAAYFDDALTQLLLAAALAGDLAQAKAAVARGASPDAEGPKSNPYNHLRLLHYAIAANSVPGIRTLIAVGANPEIGTQGSASLPLLFAVNLDKPELLSLMLDLRPVDTLSTDTNELLMFRSVALGRPKCLAVVMKHGVPIDYPDEAGATVLMRAIDAQDYDLAAWLMEPGASVTFVAHDRTIAWSLEFHLAKYVPGSPPYQKVLALKQMAEQRGAVFPAKSPKQRREERKAVSAG